MCYKRYGCRPTVWGSIAVSAFHDDWPTSQWRMMSLSVSQIIHRSRWVGGTLPDINVLLILTQNGNPSVISYGVSLFSPFWLTSNCMMLVVVIADLSGLLPTVMKLSLSPLNNISSDYISMLPLIAVAYPFCLCTKVPPTLYIDGFLKLEPIHQPVIIVSL